MMSQDVPPSGQPPAGRRRDFIAGVHLLVTLAVLTAVVVGAHSGLGLRRIGSHMECRDALDYRLLFKRDGDALLFVFYGTHDEVRAFSKNQR